ncbi:hypothetical protein BO94DRAFT_571966 [Aspergillus sclerotioniger CBS 115572]|uniref:Uncharacterized protein n=1 Tax=Aspergillus sclerotioniger CBS 115572 TaxID=1450535 RepID=A0A317XB90_9EURO|nr:hypothetical protein BO94DRAFT_571966 [Aspergillus sclerotioniger CBS 115572]PWY95381.1 hypothetical protein BO94DRAFT_571966 [Aspergillus sclerotioniger CBS 115572]
MFHCKNDSKREWKVGDSLFAEENRVYYGELQDKGFTSQGPSIFFIPEEARRVMNEDGFAGKTISLTLRAGNVLTAHPLIPQLHMVKSSDSMDIPVVHMATNTGEGQVKFWRIFAKPIVRGQACLSNGHPLEYKITETWKASRLLKPSTNIGEALGGKAE